MSDKQEYPGGNEHRHCDIDERQGSICLHELDDLTRDHTEKHHSQRERNRECQIINYSQRTEDRRPIQIWSELEKTRRWQIPQDRERRPRNHWHRESVDRLVVRVIVVLLVFSEQHINTSSNMRFRVHDPPRANPMTMPTKQPSSTPDPSTSVPGQELNLS